MEKSRSSFTSAGVSPVLAAAGDGATAPPSPQPDVSISTSRAGRACCGSESRKCSLHSQRSVLAAARSSVSDTSACVRRGTREAMRVAGRDSSSARSGEAYRSPRCRRIRRPHRRAAAPPRAPPRGSRACTSTSAATVRGRCCSALGDGSLAYSYYERATTTRHALSRPGFA